MDVLRWPPCWWYVLAFPVTAYHVWRGWALQWEYGGNAEPLRTYAPGRFKVLRCLSDAILYGVCSVVGFGSLLIAWRVVASVDELRDISPTAATLAGALGIIGVLGVTCQLPHLFQGGKILPR
jgi:hypothetical protein